MPTNPKDYMKQYYKEKKAYILSRMREPVACDICNTKITRSNFLKHLSSKKHKKMESSENVKQITMNEITDQMETLKRMIDRVEKLSVENKPENVLRRVFGSLGKEEKKRKEENESDNTSDESDIN